MQRYGKVIRLKPEKYEEYKRLHASPWPAVNAMLSACNITNYSIYHKDGYLFSYFEYMGSSFEADMRKMAADPATKSWWALTDSCQELLDGREAGEWWSSMEELFHLD